jgi:Domain of Unknown Function (DUF1907)
MKNLTVEKFLLDPPPLQKLATCISEGLCSNFKHVSVSVTECPDLRQAPYNLAGAGLGGSPRVADIGGQAHLAPIPQLDKIYSLLDITRSMEMNEESGFIIGAGAGPFRIVGVNSELMPNLSWDNGNVTNLTHYAKVQDDGSAFCDHSLSDEFSLMANIFGSNGSAGPVLKIVASTRTGKLNFTDAIRAAVKTHYGSRIVSIGGVFLIKKGKANIHVMPDFPPEPFKSREDVEKWLHFYEMDAILTCLSVFHSHDPGFDLRIEHTHCFSDNGGGHYHFDTTPEEVEYEAYFNVAEVLYRIDRPKSAPIS